jgi:hypothetical protein
MRTLDNFLPYSNKSQINRSKPIIDPMNNSEPYILLREKVRQNDALLMTVKYEGAQQYTGYIHQVYSRRFEQSNQYDSEIISFVGAPNHWGATILKDGEKALVFVKYLTGSERYYQHHWQSHFTVVDHNGTLCAIANWQLLQEHSTWEPQYLRESAFLLDPSRLWQVTMPYSLIERHLYEELAHLNG